MYLAQKIRISDGNQSENKTYTTLGVSGIELSKDLLRNIMFKASDGVEVAKYWTEKWVEQGDFPPILVAIFNKSGEKIVKKNKENPCSI